MTEPCRLIGVLDNGADGLTPQALRHVREADVVIGGQRALALFAAHLKPGAETRDLGAQLSQVPGWVEQARANRRKVVVLATGDPLCHGIGKYLGDKLGCDALDLLPNVTTLQLAFARLCLAWQDAHICSIHSKDAGDWTPGAGPEHGLYALLQATRQYDLLAVFTSPENTPARIARMLVAEGLDAGWHMTVAERLLQAGERVLRNLTLAEAAQQDFADPNVVVLTRCIPAEKTILFGLADERFHQRKPDKGLITKREVRAVSLARLQLTADSIVWDKIGRAHV